jgi:hypothetical protein
MGSVDIYYDGEPCRVSSGWNNVSIWSQKGRLRDITGMKSFECRLRKKSIAACESEAGAEVDGMDGTIYVERATFFDFMRPYLFDLFRQCDWALQRRLLVFPMLT